MRQSVRILLFASMVAAWSCMAVSAEKHLLLGTWAVDISTVQSPDPPKSVTLTLEEAGEGSYHMTVVIEESNGTISKAAGTFKPDGSVNHVTDNADFDTACMTMPTRRTLVMAGAFGGHPSSTRVWTLSDDGKHMIETAIRHLPDGTPYQRVVSWARR